MSAPVEPPRYQPPRLNGKVVAFVFLLFFLCVFYVLPRYLVSWSHGH